MHTLIKVLADKAAHKKILLLAIPMVLSNITVPLLGLVDTAVIGHLQHPWYLGGVALGSTIISVTFWLIGFLRMSSTGLAAQAYGSKDKRQLALVLLQGIVMALLFAMLFLLVHRLIANFLFSWSDASDLVKHYATEYFYVRVWSAPASLINFVLLGWLLGTQNSKGPMWMVIITNICNIAFDLLFVVVLDWKVQGAAGASVLSDYIGMLFGFCCVFRVWQQMQLPQLKTLFSALGNHIGRFVALNRDIFLRSLCLQLAYSFMTFRGASFGDDVVAANAILMSLVMVISYAMDGFAYAIEALVGNSVGSRDRALLFRSVIGAFFWSLLICILLTAVFACLGDYIIGFLTSIPTVQAKAMGYLPWLVAMPLASVWCYLLDGIFIGATKGREMRNGMFVSVCAFFAVFYLFADWGNNALWLAFICFSLVRALSLAVIAAHQWRKNIFLNP